MEEIEKVEIHRKNSDNIYDEEISVRVEYDPYAKTYIVKYTAPTEYEERAFQTKEDAMRTMVEWAENILQNIDFQTYGEYENAARQIAQIRIEYHILGNIRHYTHSSPEGTPIWNYGDTITIYCDEMGKFPRYHIYYEDGRGGESYEGFYTLEEARIWATAIAENTIGYHAENEEWGERATEIRKEEGW